MILKKQLLLALLGFTLFTGVAYSAVGDLQIGTGDVYLSKKNPVAGKTVRIYCTVRNKGDKDALASVRFSDNKTGSQIGTDQPISLIVNKTDDVFVDFKPGAGWYDILVEIIPWDPADNPVNNRTIFKMFVDSDYDGDGVGNLTDIDDDNDGIADLNDPFPLNSLEWLDTDNDGIGNTADDDDDNDGHPDFEDDFPLDKLQWLDTDSDGIGDDEDVDDDSDGLLDTLEDINKNGILDDKETDPLSSDTDVDGYDDKNDKFPRNPDEWSDFDGDGIGDNSDKDDDGDKIPDTLDFNPNNHSPEIKVTNSVTTIAVGGDFSINTRTSDDPDGKITRTIIVIEKIDKQEAETISASGQLSPLKENDNASQVNTLPSNINTTTQNENAKSILTDGENTGSGNVSKLIESQITNSDITQQNNSKLSQNKSTSNGTQSIQSENMVSLNSTEGIIRYYMNEKGEIIVLDSTQMAPEVWTLLDEGKVVAFEGKNIEGQLQEPGKYKVTIIAQDNKGEVSTKEMIIKVRDYKKLASLGGIYLLVCLAMFFGFKYIPEAFRLLLPFFIGGKRYKKRKK